MNIEGIVRQLPLFEPPIDPAMLVRARAAGIDLSSALADLSAPLPHYRFAVMLQKTYALNQTVRGLGSALLSALEKADADALSILRANQEVALLEAVRQVKKLAIEEARYSLEGAEQSLEVVNQRRDYYTGLISAGWLVEENSQKKHIDDARVLQNRASTISLIGGIVAAVPEIKTGLAGTLSSPVTVAKIIDGLSLAKASELGALSQSMQSAAKSALASISSLTGGFLRRAQEWQNQKELALREINKSENRSKPPRFVWPWPNAIRKPRASDRERAFGSRVHGAEVHERGTLPVDGRPAVFALFPELPVGLRPREAD